MPEPVLVAVGSHRRPLPPEGPIRRTGAIASPTVAADPDKLILWPVGAGPLRITDFVLVAGVQSGAIDFARLPALQASYAKAAGLNVTVKPSLTAYDVSTNLNKAPFNNPKVIEALRYAFDRQAFVDVITNGLGSTTSQPFPQGYLAFNPEVEKIWNYDPDKAALVLNEAGYGPGALSIEITSLANGVDRAEVAQWQLKKVGIESTINVVPPGSSTWQSEVYIAKDPQLARRRHHRPRIARAEPARGPWPEGIMNLSGPHASPEFTAALAVVRRTPLGDPEYTPRLWNAVKVGVEQSPTIAVSTAPRAAL